LTRVIFETATIADSCKKAAKVAPAKGQAFDKAAGVLFEISKDVTSIRATNLEIFYTEWVDVVEVEGDPTTWRLPAQLLASVLGSLPIGTGRTTEFRQDRTVLHVASGRTKARFNLMDPQYYPFWTAFNPDDLATAPELGGRISQVAWAASSNVADVPFCGVRLDGETAVATDRYRLATVPLKISGLTEPVTVPGSVLSQVLSKSGEVSITVEDQQVLIMPDEHSQIRCICFAAKYPSTEKIMKRDYPATLVAKKAPLLEMMSRALNFAGSDRTPTMRLFIGKEEIAVMMANAEIGLLGDVVDVAGYATHKRAEYRFSPKNVMDALINSPNEEVTLGYDPENTNSVVYVDGGSGYEVWIAPRRDNSGV
jgi:DNA polymerase III sliding clamp (beta) subunit (PCNA family)